MFEHGYALLIGVDQNKVAKLALPIVKKDVTKLKDVITHPERCGYLEDNVRVLTGTEATREKILDGLDWLKVKLDADASTNQTAFIYYSGHGHREASGESFLIPYDARFPVRLGGLAAKDFAESIDSIRPRRLLVVLDCCHAEDLNVKDATGSGLTPAAVTPDTSGVGLLAEGDGRAVLSSSRGSQQSWIRNDGQMSVFTYHLVEALTGHAGRPAWPNVTVTEVMEYVGRTVPATARSQHSADQDPVFRYSGTAFPIALVLGGKGIQKDVAAPDPMAELPVRISSTMTVDNVKGEATNVEIEEMRRGQLDATTTAEEVGKGGRLTGVKIGTLGGGDSTRPRRSTKKAKPPVNPEAPARTRSGEPEEPRDASPTIGTSVRVGKVSGGQVIGTQVSERGGDTVHGDRVDVASGGLATLNRGIGGENVQISSVTIYQGTDAQPGTGATPKPDEHVVEERLRLDVALPKTTVVDEPFDLVVQVRQPEAPTLTVADLDQVVSAEGSIFRNEESQLVKYRIEVTGAGFQAMPASFLLKLRPRENSRLVTFQVVASKPGKRGLFVNAYQEDGALAAQTRLSVEVVVTVQPG